MRIVLDAPPDQIERLLDLATAELEYRESEGDDDEDDALAVGALRSAIEDALLVRLTDQEGFPAIEEDAQDF